MRSAKAFSCGQLLANMPLAVMLVDFHGSPEHLRPSEHLLNDETGRLTPARRCMAFGEGALEAEVHACLGSRDHSPVFPESLFRLRGRKGLEQGTGGQERSLQFRL